ncbi:MAG: hypothetical protein ACHQM6_02345 [Candidatus Kapaibacterium sp.]
MQLSKIPVGGRYSFKGYAAPILLYLAIIIISNVTFAQGGPPMLTDDSGTPGDGNWEDNFAFVFNGSRNSYTKDFPVADLNYGVGSRIQLKTEIAWVAGNGEPLSGKFDYISPGLKYRFLDEKEDGVSFSTFPSITASFQPEDKNKTAEFGFFLPFEISKEFFGFSLNAQAGYRLMGKRSGWAFGLVACHDLGSTTALLLELHSTLDRPEGQASFDGETFLDLGAQINLSEHFTILTAIGKSLTSPSLSSADANVYGYFGLQLHL